MYKFSKGADFLKLKSEVHTVILRPVKGHIHVTVRGRWGWRKQGLSSVHQDLTEFEMRVAALHFYKLARDYQKGMRIRHVNYAEIFGSCFE